MNVYVIVDVAATFFDGFLLLYLLQNEEIKGSKLKQIFLFLPLALAIITMTILDFTIWSKVLVQLLLIVIIGRFIYVCSLFKLFFYGLINNLAIMFSEEVVLGIWNIFNKPVLSDNIIYEDFSLTLLIVAKAFDFFIVLLLKKITVKDKEKGGVKELLPILAVGIPFLLVFECINIFLIHIQGERERTIYFICCLAMLFAFIYILTFFEKYLHVQRKAHKEELALQELQLSYDYYERRKEDEEKVREIYHDLKNHLLLLKDDKGAENITKKIEAYESYINTGNEYLDIIISEKVKMAQKHNIRIECDLDFSAGTFIEPLDISTLFGNIIDNAIEAAAKVTDSEKYIFIHVRRKAHLIIIVIRNSLSGTFNYEKKTTKLNSSFHGYGLANVKRVLRKYNGDLDIIKNDNEFRISIVLPIPSLF